MRRATVLRALIAAIGVGGLIWAVRNLPDLSCATVQAYGDSGGGFSVVLGASIVAILLCLPRWLVIVGCGMTFGFALGALAAQVAAWLGALIAFIVARYIARDAVTKFLLRYKWFRGFGETLGSNGTSFSFFLRLNPLFHFSIFSYACGLIPIRFWPYALGTFLGMAPASIALAYAGEVLGCAMIDEDATVPLEAQLWLAAAFVSATVLSLLPAALAWWKKRERER